MPFLCGSTGQQCNLVLVEGVSSPSGEERKQQLGRSLIGY